MADDTRTYSTRDGVEYSVSKGKYGPVFRAKCECGIMVGSDRMKCPHDLGGYCSRHAMFEEIRDDYDRQIEESLRGMDGDGI